MELDNLKLIVFQSKNPTKPTYEKLAEIIILGKNLKKQIQERKKHYESYEADLKKKIK